MIVVYDCCRSLFCSTSCHSLITLHVYETIVGELCAKLIVPYTAQLCTEKEIKKKQARITHYFEKLLAPMKTVRFLGMLDPIASSAYPILAVTNSVRRLLGLVKTDTEKAEPRPLHQATVVIATYSANTTSKKWENYC